MSKTAQVVDGEASESESEVELGKPPESVLPKVSKPFVIAGEAPESDDESRPSQTISDGLHNAPATPQTPNSSNNSRRFNFNSLLHQKLWECNVSLRSSFEALLRQTTELAADKLTRSDKMLLNVQESMRSTNANLTLARARLNQMATGLDNANCSSALPSVKIK